MVTTTTLGPNSGKVEYTAGELLANVIQAVEDYIVAHGWSVHDAGAGANARAYKALNKDGVTYKYIVLDYNTSGYLMIKTYESWNASTHVGTNLCYYSDNSTSFAQRVDITNGGSLHVFVSSRYVVIQSQVPAGIGSFSGSAWTGCIEVTRDNPEDTPAAGYPCWIWANGYGLHTSSSYVCSFPRMRDGGIAANASAYNFVSTEMAYGGYSPSGYYYLYQQVSSLVNVWNGKNWAFTLRVGKNYGNTIEKRGRLYGVKLITKAQGGFLDTISIKTDADGFVDPNGTTADHWVLIESQTSGRFAIPK